MIEKKNLPAFYKKQIKPKIRKFEIKREKVKKKLIFAIISGVIMITSAFILFEVRNVPPLLSAVAVVIAAIITFKKGRECYKLYRTYYIEFKKEVVENIIHLIVPGCYYEHDKSISRELYQESKIFSKGVDKWQGDDLVTGSIEKTKFQFSELHTQYKTTSTDSKGRRKTQWHTIFKGIFFIADFNKNIKSETFVLPDSAESMFGNWIGRKLQNLSSNFHDKGELVRLENPMFEKQFVVYSKDQQEARYILTPKLMEKIVAIKRKSKKNIHLSFKGNRVFVGVSYAKNLFEPSIWSSCLQYKDVKEVYNTLHSIFSLVSELDLNLRIWTKE